MNAKTCMKVLSGACFLVSVLGNGLAQAGQGGISARVVYGEDNRLDLYQVQNSQHLDLARSTVALIQSRNLVRDGGKFKISGSELGTEMGLCSDEPFWNQPSAAFCSGFLVADDMILTAGHCIQSASECASTKFLFDFAVSVEGQLPTHADPSQIVSCKDIVAHKFERSGADYTLVRIDRKVTDREILEVNRSNDLRNRDAVGVIGHPSGIPTKVAFGAKVRDTSRPGYFVANLDTYGGNSGSAVFNELTGKVEGILVRGEQDYVYDSSRGCTRSKVCAEDACRGEDVTKISEVANHIPQR